MRRASTYFSALLAGLAVSVLTGCSSSGSGGLFGATSKATTDPAPDIAAASATATPAPTTSATTGQTPQAIGVTAQPAVLTQDDQSAVAATPAAVVAEGPLDKAIHVGWTMARAQKCGFFFEPQKVHSNFLAYETQRGVSDQDVKRRDLTVRYTRAKVAKQIAPIEDYCSRTVLTEVREDLPKFLAGDFSGPARLPPVKNKEEGGLFASLTSGSTGVRQMTREELFTPPSDRWKP